MLSDYTTHMNSEEKKQLEAKLKNIVSNMPEQPGSYQYYDDKGTIIYVGKAKNLRRRVLSYFRPGANHAPKVRSMVNTPTIVATVF